MSPSEHLFAWGMNDGDYYRRAADIHTRNPKPFTASVAHDAYSWARDVHADARRAGDLPTGTDAYTAADIIGAAALFLSTDMEL